MFRRPFQEREAAIAPVAGSDHRRSGAESGRGLPSTAKNRPTLLGPSRPTLDWVALRAGWRPSARPGDGTPPHEAVAKIRSSTSSRKKFLELGMDFPLLTRSIQVEMFTQDIHSTQLTPVRAILSFSQAGGYLPAILLQQQGHCT
jgi:hypothetical protein